MKKGDRSPYRYPFLPTHGPLPSATVTLSDEEREVLRGLVAVIGRADHDADEEIAAAARNAVGVIARLVEARDAD
mgnify:CR=1 FL=1